MKKYLYLAGFVLAFLFNFLTPCDAQLSFAARGGFTFASQSYKYINDDFKTGLLPGITVGGMAEYQLTDNISLAGGLQFMTKGNSSKDDGEKYKLKFSHIQIPIQAQYHYEQFYGALGFYVGSILGGKYVDEDGDDFKLDIGKSVDDDFAGGDAGLILEAGYEFKTGLRGSVFLHSGFQNQIPKEAQKYYDDVVKNNVIGLTVTYFFLTKNL